MMAPSDSLIVRLSCRIIARILQIFAVYVVFHGHYSPGGGFQGGGLLAAAVILMRIGEGEEGSRRELHPKFALAMGSLGGLVFLLSGTVNMLTKGYFLEYAHIPFASISAADLHYWEILVIEVGIAFAVMGILVFIFDQLFQGAQDND